MRNEWMEIFSQEGYRFCKVKPEETGVFYKYYEEGFHLVMFIDIIEWISADDGTTASDAGAGAGTFLSSGGKVTGLPGRISGVPCGTADHFAHESV